jgi:hypothetical protein
MRYAASLIMLLLCLMGRATAQNSPLDKIISVRYHETPVSFILKDIQKRYSVNFSYSNNLLSLSRKITVNIKDQSLDKILDQIFQKTDITYLLIGTQIVLKKSNVYHRRGSTGYSGNVAFVSGKSSNRTANSSADERNIPSDSLVQLIPAVYETSTMVVDSIINPMSLTYVPIITHSRQQLKKQYRASQKRLKERYSLLTDSMNQTDKHGGDRIKENIRGAMFRIQSELNRISVKLAGRKKNLFSDNQSFDSTGYVYQPLQISFVPPLSSNGYRNSKTVNNVSLNVLAGYASGLEGLELGGIANIEKDYMRGLQFAGIGNFVKNDVTGGQYAGWMNVSGGLVNGSQAAGYINIALDSVRGAQITGLTNFTEGSMRGVQVSGLFNVVNHSIKGVQIAGLMNFAGKSSQAVEVAGLLNIASGDLSGIQVSGIGNVVKGNMNGTQLSVFNKAGKVSSQIGFINFADSVSGVQVGLLSVAGKGGYRRLELSGSESMYVNAVFKLGGKKLYNIFAAAAQPLGEKFRWGIGYGFGTQWELGETGTIHLDALCYQINEGEFWTKDHLNLLNQLKLTVGFKLWKGLYLFAGPTWNVMVSGLKDAQGATTGSELAPWTSFNKTDGKTNVKMWPGVNAGVRF